MRLNMRSPIIVVTVIASLVAATGLLAGYLSKAEQTEGIANTACGKVACGPCDTQISVSQGCYGTCGSDGACEQKSSCCCQTTDVGPKEQGCACETAGCCDPNSTTKSQ
jgi:hypothetical protein